MDIINDLKALKATGLSESEIARRCQVPQATIWRLLHDDTSKPSYKTILKIWPVIYGDDQSGRPISKEGSPHA